MGLMVFPKNAAFFDLFDHLLILSRSLHDFDRTFGIPNSDGCTFGFGACEKHSETAGL